MVLRPPPARIRRHPDVAFVAGDQDAILLDGWYPLVPL
jgi:hypothetical protein